MHSLALFVLVVFLYAFQIRSASLEPCIDKLIEITCALQVVVFSAACSESPKSAASSAAHFRKVDR
ncbi:MAG: hypothetical protein LBU32_28395 [Clostridiales bacterium]|nr:hypothetical protein [Clostridiales bacterium]